MSSNPSTSTRTPVVSSSAAHRCVPITRGTSTSFCSVLCLYSLALFLSPPDLHRDPKLDLQNANTLTCDELIPILVYCICYGMDGPSGRPVARVRMLADLTEPDRQLGELGFALTTLQCAVEHLEGELSVSMLCMGIGRIDGISVSAGSAVRLHSWLWFHARLGSASSPSQRAPFVCVHFKDRDFKRHVSPWPCAQLFLGPPLLILSTFGPGTAGRACSSRLCPRRAPEPQAGVAAEFGVAAARGGTLPHDTSTGNGGELGDRAALAGTHAQVGFMMIRRHEPG